MSSIPNIQGDGSLLPPQIPKRFSYNLVGDAIASNAESAERFSAGQAEWIAFSEATINEAVDLLPKLTNDPHPITTIREIFGLSEVLPPMLQCEEELTPTKFGKLLLFLANKRAEIAKQLHHGAEDTDQKGCKGRTEEYGDIRFYSTKFSTNRMIETVSREGEKIWATQSKEIFAAIDELLNIEYDEPFCHYSTEKAPYYIQSRIDEKGDLKLRMELNYYCPEEIWRGKYTKDTVTFHMDAVEDEGKPKVSRVHIEYAYTDEYRLPGDMAIANYYLEKMLAWEPKQGVAAFMVDAGHLAQHTICLLPLRLGSAAVIEWMLRAVAFSRGIVLGDFNQSNGISWDFKALVTPNREAYAHWFANNVFNSVKTLNA